MRKKTILTIIILLLLLGIGLSCSPKEEYVRETSRDTKLSKSMVLANKLANGVQGFFVDPQRTSYRLVNENMEISHALDFNSLKQVSSLRDKKGRVYLENTMDVFVEAEDGTIFFAKDSTKEARINTTRFGYYYYETQIRELNFVNANIKALGDGIDISNFQEGKWRGNDVEDIKYSDEGLIMLVKNTADPYIAQSGFNVDYRYFNAVQVTMKIEGQASIGEVFFHTYETKTFNSTQRISFSARPDGKFHTYIIDLKGTGLLDSDLTGIRFDLGDRVGDKITIQSVKLINATEGTLPFYLDKTIHAYSNKVHQEFRLVASGEYSDPIKFAFETRLDTKNVTKIQYRDKNGIGTNLEKMDAESIEYIGFDIKKVGILGFIFPPDGTTNRVELIKEGDSYILHQYASMDAKSFGHRLYTDSNHTFDVLDKEAYKERNPLSNIEIDGSSDQAQYLKYDFLRGAYQFTMQASGFNEAYYNKPDKHYKAIVSIKGDEEDRQIYIWMNTIGKGELECASLLDDTDTLIPIPLQVCKNFQGEIEEAFYDPEDKAYGDTFFPLVIEKNEKTDFTLINLYQNWGLFPLKQLSSIQFHVSYYHLSTGVSESNCISMYGVHGKDGWILPDFRGCSGIMWQSQPQYNYAGKIYTTSYYKEDGLINKSEYLGSNIKSSGPTYADLEYSYISDDGAYKYSLRHVEFPQTDENRTYYTISIEFLKKLEFKSVRDSFSILKVDSRMGNTYYNYISYLDENNEEKEEYIDSSKANIINYRLGKDKPFIAYFDLTNGEEVMNLGLVIKDTRIRLSNKDYDGSLIFKSSFANNMNEGYLSLDLGKWTFKKGDKIEIDLILLPFGSHLTKDYKSIQTVREDSALKPLAVEAIKGQVIEDAFIPRIKAKDNEAEFTISGGRNNNVFVVESLTSLKRPKVYKLVDGQWLLYEYNPQTYDGYNVHFNKDGTYNFSFVFYKEGPDEEVTFKLEG